MSTLPASMLLAPHRRLNPLTGEWVLVSPHRLLRPWQGKTEKVDAAERPHYDPQCYLCPGNTRANGQRNPAYTGTFVFDNDFAALKTDGADLIADHQGLFVAAAEHGLCRVICFSPRHDLTLAEMDVDEIKRVVDVWRDQYLELGARSDIGHVQIFENKGALMGCSNPHPHGQIWASHSVPTEVAIEDGHQFAHFARHSRPMLETVAEHEAASGERVVAMNGDWLAVVPFWAKWPYELLVVPRERARHLGDLDEGRRRSLAAILSAVTIRYDNLFETSFPYTMGIHQAPTNCAPNDHWTMHLHFYPPLLRSATIQKFMVGYEMLAEAQRDLTPEQAAERLRTLPSAHYKHR